MSNKIVMGAAAEALYAQISKWARDVKANSLPTAGLEWKYSRSSGPGGQHVNKVSTKAELQVDLAAWSQWLPTKVADKLGGAKWVVKSELHRSLEANKQECLEKVVMRLKEAAEGAVPKPTSAEQFSRVERM